MKPGQPQEPDVVRAAMVDEDPLFDRRSLFIGIGVSVLLLAIAMLWRVAYRERPDKIAKLRDFEFAPKPPEEKKFELKELQREVIRETVQDQPDYEAQETPNIQITTQIRETDIREEVIKTRNVEMTPITDVRMGQLDVVETMEKVDVVADERVDALTPIAVLSTSPGDIFAYAEPQPRASPRAQLVGTAPQLGKQIKVALRQFGDQDAVTVGELGAVDINLFGTGGGYLDGGMGRAGLETRTAVDAALRWLALHQEAEGFWSPDRWNADDASMDAAAPKAGASAENHAVGMTGFATLALMGGGNNLRKGEYRMNVRRAMLWLAKQQDPVTGYLSKNMYEHAIATIGLCEAYGRSPDEQIGVTARKAVEACVAAASRDGGWRYDPNPPDSDMSVSSWFLQALKTAKLANIKFDYGAFARGVTRLDQCTDMGGLGETTGGVGYQPGDNLKVGTGSPALTCAGMVIRQFNGMGVNHPVLLRGAELTKSTPPAWDRKDFYYWYYATFAMHNMGGESRLWWNRRIRDVLLDNQSRRGHQAGSWSPEKDRWCKSRVYTTALGALCLEVYYRYGEALQSFGTVAELEELTFQ